MFSSWAWAQSAAAQPTMIEQLAPMAFIAIIFYFLLIRPQQNRAKKHQEFVTNLKRGDKVLTQGGLYGVIDGITDQFVILEIADDVNVRVLRSQISSPIEKEATT
ncbi:MAG: preprotein translocase subunit YajC [Pseudomonadota bacterium]